MTRIDYFDDPTAPAVTAVVPSAVVVVRNGSGDLLLIHRTDNDLWGLAGGAIEAGICRVRGV